MQTSVAVELDEWLRTTPGLKLNPDGHYGLQCVDLADAYAEAIFPGVSWRTSLGGVNGARELLDSSSNEFWWRTDNDPNNPALIPSRWDVVVFGGTAANPYGHVAVVESADQNGMWVIQQDGFAAPRVFVDGAWYSDKPAHRVWLPYWGPGTGAVSGWLTPKEHKVVGYREPVADVVLPHQRVTVPDSKVGYRAAPRADAELLAWFEPDHKYDFKGYVRDAAGAVWFVGAFTGGFSKATGYVDEGTHDLPDLTEQLLPSVPVIAPPVQPEQPVQVYTGQHLNGLDVSTYQESVDLSTLPGDFLILKATEGVGWVDPSLASSVAEARKSGKLVGFYHFARPLAQDGNTAQAEAKWFLDTVRPYLQAGDRLFLDWEAENQDRTDWAKSWLDTVAWETTSTPSVYLNATAINGADWTAVEATYPLWFAGGKLYGTQVQGYKPRDPADAQTSWVAGFEMWQYTGQGRLPGYDKDLDLNVFYGDASRWKDLGVRSAPQVPEDPEEVEDTPTEPQPDPVPAVGFTADQATELADLADYLLSRKDKP